MAGPARVLKIWEDESIALYDERPRSRVPTLPTIGDSIQVFKVPEGGKAALAYLACVIRDTSEKMIVMRALASAVAILFGDSSNLTGSPSAPLTLTGLDQLTEDNVSASAVLKTNFSGAPDFSVADIDTYLDCDSDELGGYFGVLFYAGVKRLTEKNSTAFNEKRVGTITSAIVNQPKIFVPGSAFLDAAVLNKVYAAFTSLAAIRANLVYRTALKMGTIRYGSAVTFTAFFLLLADSGMGSLRVIKEAVLKCPWVRTDFPEIRIELEMANAGQNAIKEADPPLRPFIKAIYGSAFVPVAQNDIQNLLGISKRIMSHYVQTFSGFRGGRTTPEQDAKIDARLGITIAIRSEQELI